MRENAIGILLLTREIKAAEISVSLTHISPVSPRSYIYTREQENKRSQTPSPDFIHLSCYLLFPSFAHTLQS